jgi:hypothetical protein
MFFIDDFKASVTDGFSGHINQLVVSDWSVAFGWLWSLNFRKDFRADFVFCVDKHNGSLVKTRDCLSTGEL